jgi:hypothetical protein
MNARCALAAMSAGLILLASQANGKEKLHRVGVLAQSEIPEQTEAWPRGSGAKLGFHLRPEPVKRLRVRAMHGTRTRLHGCGVRPSEGSTAKGMVLPDGAINFNIGTLVGSDASVAAMLDEAARVPRTKGIMLTFDDFLIGMEQFGQRIRPLWRPAVPASLTGIAARSLG